MIINKESRENLELMYAAICDGCDYNDVDRLSFEKITKYLCRIKIVSIILKETGLLKQFTFKPFPKTILND